MDAPRPEAEPVRGRSQLPAHGAHPTGHALHMRMRFALQAASSPLIVHIFVFLLCARSTPSLGLRGGMNEGEKYEISARLLFAETVLSVRRVLELCRSLSSDHFALI